MKRRILAAALTLCLTMSLVPTAAFAVGGKSFDDVNGHWGQASVERWASYGVLNGDNFGNFNPDKQMTRAEFATMLANMMGYTAKASNSFGDVAADAWYADAILKLAAAGVMLGDNNGNANPNKPISRAEAAVMMCRAFNIPSSNASLNFADSASVADWARGSMAALAERGMMNGVGSNQLAPLANITRASVAKLVDNMISEYVTESKTITGDVKGIVLVVGDADVTIQDATLSENLIVAPKAAGAEVTLTGSTTASDIYVDAAAAVKVDTQASAGDVQLSAPKASAEVAGKADTVTTTAAASEATVTVAKDAAVSKVEVAAPNTALNVAGKIDSVNVASTASGAEVKTESTGTVANVTTSANDVKVSGNGKVENVTATGGTAAVTTPGTNVENKTDSADNVTANGKPVPPTTGGTTTPTKPSGSGGGGGGGNKPSATTYTITVDGSVTNGKISVDPASAEEGTTVTVTGTPDAEYALKSITVTKEASDPEPPAGGDDTDSETTPPSDDNTDNNDGTPSSQAEDANAIEVTSAGDNKFTFKMPAGNVTVTGEFYKPLTDFQVLLINNTTEYAKLPTEFKTWDGSPNSAGWDNLETYPWLAITGKVAGTSIPAGGYTDETLLTGTLNITFKSGTETQNVTSPWGENQVIGKYGALTAYVKEPPEFDSNGDKLGVTKDFGNFTVTLTYKGATYTGTANYIAKDAAAFLVTFDSKGGTPVAGQVVAKDGTVEQPDAPTRTGYTFGGWYKEEALSSTWNFDTDKVTAATTLYAKWTPVEYTVTFSGADGINPIKANYGAKITAPTAPTADGKYFVGWYKDDKFAEKWNFDTDTVAGDTTLYAKFMDIQTVKATFRSPGHAKGLAAAEVASFDYAAEYVKAGITINTDGTKVTITGDTLKAYLDAALADNAAATLKNPLDYLSIDQGGKYLMYGIELSDAPNGAATVYVNRVIQNGTTTVEDKGFAGIDMNTDTPIDITKDSLNSFDGKYVDYSGAAGYSDSETAYTYQGAQTRTYYLIWLDAQGEIIAVQKTAAIQRELVPVTENSPN